MSLLENKSVEHAFAIHIDEEGNSHIQFLSIGGVTGKITDKNIRRELWRLYTVFSCGLGAMETRFVKAGGVNIKGVSRIFGFFTRCTVCLFSSTIFGCNLYRVTIFIHNKLI